MNIKQLCEQCNYEYDSKNPSRSLKALQNNYLITQLRKGNYQIERELTAEEKILVTNRNHAEKLLYYIVISRLSQSPNNTIRANMKQLLELFSVVNSKYKLFSYENMNKTKLKVLESTNLSQPILENFYSDTHPILSRMMKNVLHTLENELLIKVNIASMHSIIGYYKGERYTVNLENSPDDTENILRITRNMIITEGKSTCWDDSPYWLKEKIKKAICKELGWHHMYDDYIIILNREGLSEEFHEQILNSEVCKKIGTSKQGELKNYDKQLLEDCINLLVKIS